MLVTALTSGGQQMWTTSIPNGSFGTAVNGQPSPVGDGNGGILAPVGESGAFGGASGLADLDGPTGSKIWEYDAPSGQTLGIFAVGPDGTVFVNQISVNQVSVVAVNRTTGAGSQIYSLPQSTLAAGCTASPTIITDFTGTSDEIFTAAASSPIVGPDGSVFLNIFSENKVNTSSCGGPDSAVQSDTQTISLVQIPPGGSPVVTQLNQSVNPSGQLFSLLEFGPVIPDGQGGALASWNFIPDIDLPRFELENESHISDVSSSGLSDFPTSVFPTEMVLGDNGMAFVTDQVNVVALNVTGGSAAWSYTSQSTTAPLDLVAAISGGGLTVNDGSAGIVAIDPSGNPTTSGITASAPSPWPIGNWVGIMGDPTLTMFVGTSTDLAVTDWVVLQGSRQTKSAAPKLSMSVFMPVAPGLPNNTTFGTTTSAGNNIVAALSKKPVDVRLFLDTNPPLATVQNFKDNVATPLDIVAFIGHAFLISVSGVNISVGLRFRDLSLVVNNSPALTFTPNEMVVRTGPIQTAAKVIFIGSCDTNSAFLSMWDINTDTITRALVVPDLARMATLNPTFSSIDQGSVDLVQATIALEQITILLSKGESVSKAVGDTNTFLSTLYQNNPGLHNNPLAQWTVIGGQNVQPKSQK